MVVIGLNGSKMTDYKKEEVQALFQSFEDAKCMVDETEC